MTHSVQDSKISPMMAQWHSCKKEAPHAILLFRLGDFYEAFYEDAILVSKVLDLTLTKRQEVPMSGVPFHTVDIYIDKLVAAGYRVAVAEQIEDPKEAKGLVKREIVRVVTPGTIVNSSLLSDKTNNFLVCLTQVNSCFGLAVLDLTTSEFRAIELEDKKELLDELYRLSPSELFFSQKFEKNHQDFLEELKIPFHVKEDWHFDHRTALERLLKHFHVQTLDGFGLKEMIAAINAAGALLSYVSEDLNLSIHSIRSIQTERLSSYMALDRTTGRHLELIESLQEGKRAHTLLNHLDRTATPMGGRMMRQWLTHPLLCPILIGKRQEAISSLLLKGVMLEPLREIRDLERLIMRISSGYATPRDLVSIRLSLEQIPLLESLLQPIDAELIAEDRKQLSDVSFIAEKIKNAIVDSPPLRLSDGGIFKTGYHPDLDALRHLKSDGYAWIAQYQTQLRERTNIKTLKVGFTNAFGYYIEVSRGQANKMPEDFQRRQTLVNAERFITPELKDYEYRVLTAQERSLALETQLFHALREEIAAHAPLIRKIAAAVARLDCLFALAQVAKEGHYVRPLVDTSDRLFIEAGRHPLVEASLKKEAFIPNDVDLEGTTQRLLLITGPNMAGKSTYIRQVALIAILAQMGSFVPAKSAHIGIIDKVFSRIGASDDLSRGQSTFMVEMTETANILNNATSRSLVILDEIGRGTSTYDGISIAWAVAEYLLTQKGKMAKTLFATHYWELTQLENQIPGAKNFNVAVHESDKGIVFLRKIVKGGTDKSYGIHVARLAGLPSTVIKRAQEMLITLEKNGNRAPTKPIKPIEQQPDLFSSPHQPMIEELKTLDLSRLTPLEALLKLTDWKSRL